MNKQELIDRLSDLEIEMIAPSTKAWLNFAATIDAEMTPPELVSDAALQKKHSLLREYESAISDAAHLINELAQSLDIPREEIFTATQTKLMALSQGIWDEKKRAKPAMIGCLAPKGDRHTA